MFDKFNTNGDNAVDKKEFVAGHNMMFAKIDANGDGNISKGEMKTFMSKMMSSSKAAKCGQGKEAKSSKCGESKCGEGKCGK